MYRIMLLAIALCLCACAAAPEKPPAVTAHPIQTQPADPTQIFVALQPGGKIGFQGELPRNTADPGTAAVLYPGYHAGAFIAGVVMHAMLQQGVDSAEVRRTEKLKQEVLNKYQALLTKVSLDSLLHPNTQIAANGSNVFLQPASQAPAGSNVHLLHVKPVYWITQNDRSITLHNQLSLSESRRPEAGIKLVETEYTAALPEQDPAQGSLSEATFDRINAILQDSFVKSIEVGLRYIDNTPAAQQAITLRYLEGGQKQVERGYLISRNCDRLLFLSLRRVIKSVPTYHAGQECPARETAAL